MHPAACQDRTSAAFDVLAGLEEYESTLGEIATTRWDGRIAQRATHQLSALVIAAAGLPQLRVSIIELLLHHFDLLRECSAAQDVNGRVLPAAQAQAIQVARRKCMALLVRH